MTLSRLLRRPVLVLTLLAWCFGLASLTVAASAAGAAQWPDPVEAHSHHAAPQAVAVANDDEAVPAAKQGVDTACKTPCACAPAVLTLTLDFEPDMVSQSVEAPLPGALKETMPSPLHKPPRV